MSIEEKEKLIGCLQEQILELKAQNRDYAGVNEEIARMEERFQELCDQRQKQEQAHKQRIERLTDETNTAKRKLEELKFTLSEKQKQNADISDEQLRSRKELDSKQEEAERLRLQSAEKR